mgnify:CR=1 FL=1
MGLNFEIACHRHKVKHWMLRGQEYEMHDFIRHQPDEGFEKTSHTSEWVKKGSK